MTTDPSDNEPESVPSVTGRTLGTMLAVQVGAIVVVALYLAREVLVPITVAILLSFVLAPLVDLLRRVRLGRVPSVLLAVGMAIGILVFVGTIMGSQVAQLGTHAPEYANTIEQKITSVRGYALDRVSRILKKIGYDAKLSLTVPPKNSTETTEQLATSPDSHAAQPPSPSTPLVLIERYLKPILSPIATLGIIVVVAIFTLLQKEDLRDRIIRLFGSTDLHRTTTVRISLMVSGDFTRW